MKNLLIKSGALRVDTADVDRRPETKVLVNIIRYSPEADKLRRGYTIHD